MPTFYIDAGGDPHSRSCLLSIFQLSEHGGYKTLFVRFGMSQEEVNADVTTLREHLRLAGLNVVLVPDKCINS